MGALQPNITHECFIEAARCRFYGTKAARCRFYGTKAARCRSTNGHALACCLSSGAGGLGGSNVLTVPVGAVPDADDAVLAGGNHRLFIRRGGRREHEVGRAGEARTLPPLSPWWNRTVLSPPQLRMLGPRPMYWIEVTCLA